MPNAYKSTHVYFIALYKMQEGVVVISQPTFTSFREVYKLANVH